MPFVKDFLFTKDPIHVYHLRNPEFRNVAIAGSAVVTRIEPSGGIRSDHHEGKYLFHEPSSIGATGLGFAIYETQYLKRASEWHTPTSSPQGIPVNAKAVGRFFRDDIQRVFVVVFDAPALGIVRIEYIHLQSSTFQRRIVGIFDRERFQSLTADGCFDTDHVFPALRQLQVSEEDRECPACSLRSCACRLAFTHPRHPFDAQAFRKNMALRRGNFVGWATLITFENDTRTQAELGTRIFHRRDTGADAMDRLRNWALREFGAVDDPRHSLLSHERSESRGLAIARAKRPCFQIEPDCEQRKRTRDFDDVSEGRYASLDVFRSDPIMDNTGESVRVVWNGVPREINTPVFDENSREDTFATVVASVPSGTTAASWHGSTVGCSSQLFPTGNQQVVGQETEAMRKERKKKERIMKNREAARKSNAKRSERNRKEKETRLFLKGRVEKLRARENYLRRENGTLREKVRLKRLTGELPLLTEFEDLLGADILNQQSPLNFNCPVVPPIPTQQSLMAFNQALLPVFSNQQLFL